MRRLRVRAAAGPRRGRRERCERLCRQARAQDRAQRSGGVRAARESTGLVVTRAHLLRQRGAPVAAGAAGRLLVREASGRRIRQAHGRRLRSTWQGAAARGRARAAAGNGCERRAHVHAQGRIGGRDACDGELRRERLCAAGLRGSRSCRRCRPRRAARALRRRACTARPRNAAGANAKAGAANSPARAAAMPGMATG